MKFCNEAPKKLQEHLGKCKEALAAKAAADFAASPKMEVARRRRHSWWHLPPPVNHHSVEASEHLSTFVCFSKSQGGRASTLNN